MWGTPELVPPFLCRKLTFPIFIISLHQSSHHSSKGMFPSWVQSKYPLWINSFNSNQRIFLQSRNELILSRALTLCRKATCINDGPNFHSVVCQTIKKIGGQSNLGIYFLWISLDGKFCFQQCWHDQSSRLEEMKSSDLGDILSIFNVIVLLRGANSYDAFALLMAQLHTRILKPILEGVLCSQPNPQWKTFLLWGCLGSSNRFTAWI